MTSDGIPQLDIKWDCAVGTPDEDHEYDIIADDPDVGFIGYKQCRHCGKQEPLTDADYQDDEYDDYERNTYDDL